MTERAVLTLDDVAERLRVSRRTVDREVKGGRLRPFYVGRRPLVTEAEFAAFVAGARKRGRAA